MAYNQGMKRLLALCLLLAGCAQETQKPSDISLRVKKGWTQQQVFETVGQPTVAHTEEGEWDYIFDESGLMVVVTFDKSGRVASVETVNRS